MIMQIRYFNDPRVVGGARYGYDLGRSYLYHL